MTGPYGLERGLVKLSKNITNLNTGIVTNYALYIFVGLIIYMFTPYLLSIYQIFYVSYYIN